MKLSLLLLGLFVCGLAGLSCGTNLGVIEPTDLCKCLSLLPDASDYRHAAKHVPIPGVTPIEINVATILTWQQTPVLPPDTPRGGRELQVFHVSQAWLQNASLFSGDCDVHMEISQTADKAAPRVIVETPVDAEYCSARQTIQSQLAKHGFTLDPQHGGEVTPAIPAQVLGMAFEDFEHDRGPNQVATLWELHPAIVTLTQ